ncbi:MULTISPECIES: ParB/RepB/Spo0J family partition protein [Cupriavidus]|uniref:ParB/RepB/Spo0J family partition protein n=1 Tax=Cupriavidus TaxID=106589 RepID=UPI00046352E2|nr:ParB/RepB/Spo0J family partition protein [Cupriavidus metallidurans]KWW32329.1 Nucleoid occlusion protein [Cupriavidus metallidurans]
MTKRKLGALVGEIDMSAFQKRDGNPGASTTARPQTGVGMVMGAIAGTSDLERKLTEAQEGLEQANQRLAEYAGAELVRKLDPTTIRRSRWANRDELNFTGPDWEAFKAELASAGGNVEAIKVRRVFDRQTPPGSASQPEFEVVYGHRRHHGCLELSLPVSAIVADEMDDRTLFAEMDRENRQRENLSAWEQGRMYNQALKEGLFSSLRRLAEELGVNLSDASRCCKLAQLPDAVVQAFPSPMVIQVRWAKPLADALQSDPDGTLDRARALQAERHTLTPAEVVERLLNQPKSAKPSIPIHARGQAAAALKIGSKGRAVVEFEAGVLDPAKHDALVQLIADFLSAS